jgi:hypothetical protein
MAEAAAASMVAAVEVPMAAVVTGKFTGAESTRL